MTRFDKTPAKSARARALRADATFAERKLWTRLRASQLGTSFRRQHPAGPYVLDFYCAEFAIALELDGDQHGHAEHRRKDRKRDAWFAERGVSVLRFWNHEVITDLDGVAATIWHAIEVKRAKTPSNLPLSGGGSRRRWKQPAPQLAAPPPPPERGRSGGGLRPREDEHPP